MHCLIKKVFTIFHKNLSSWRQVDTRRQTWMDGQIGGQIGRHDKAFCSFVNAVKGSRKYTRFEPADYKTNTITI